jgi:hypothetical protein
MASPSMNAIADRFAAQEIGAIFVYTNEAHPGEVYLHLTSMEQKFRHAQALRDVYGVTRPILVDTLEGDCHRAFGNMPNMTWIFDQNGLPVYKTDWTDARSVESAIEYLLGVQERRRNGERLVPQRIERLDYRTQDREAFFHGLERNGPKAVKEFQEAFGN